jgi:hypothetical protein
MIKDIRTFPHMGAGEARLRSPRGIKHWREQDSQFE